MSCAKCTLRDPTGALPDLEIRTLVSGESYVRGFVQGRSLSQLAPLGQAVINGPCYTKDITGVFNWAIAAEMSEGDALLLDEYLEIQLAGTTPLWIDETRRLNDSQVVGDRSLVTGSTQLTSNGRSASYAQFPVWIEVPEGDESVFAQIGSAAWVTKTFNLTELPAVIE